MANESKSNLKKVLTEIFKKDAQTAADTYGTSWSNTFANYFSVTGNSEMTNKPASDQLNAVWNDMQAGTANSANAYESFYQFVNQAYAGSMGIADEEMAETILGRDIPDSNTMTDFYNHVGGEPGVFGIGKDTSFGAGSELYKDLGKQLKEITAPLDEQVSGLKDSYDKIGDQNPKAKENYEAVIADRDKAYVDYINGPLRESLTGVYAANYMQARADLAAYMSSGYTASVEDPYIAYAKSMLKFEYAKNGEETNLPTKEEYSSTIDYLTKDPESSYYGKSEADIRTEIMAENEKQLKDAFAQTVYQSGSDLSNEIGSERQNGKASQNELINNYFEQANAEIGEYVPEAETEVEQSEPGSEPLVNSGDLDNETDETEEMPEDTAETTEVPAETPDEPAESDEAEPEDTEPDEPAASDNEVPDETAESDGPVPIEDIIPVGYVNLQFDMPMGEPAYTHDEVEAEQTAAEPIAETPETSDPYSAENIKKRYELAGDDPKEIAKIDYEIAQAIWKDGAIGNGDERKKVLGEHYDRIQITVVEPMASGKMSAWLEPGTAEYDNNINSIAADSKILDAVKEQNISGMSIKSAFNEVSALPEVKSIHDSLVNGTETLESVTKDLSDAKSAERIAMAEALGGVSDGIADNIGLDY